MRVRDVRLVVAGGLLTLLPVAAWAQGGTPVQVVPVTAAGQPAIIQPVTPNRPPTPGMPAGPVTPSATQSPLSVAAAPMPAASRKLDLSFSNGKVNLTAENVTLVEIFAEWSRKCGCTVTGTEKITGPAVTLLFQNEPEVKVLDSLLRTVSGYIIGPRPAGTTGASAYGSVSVTARSTPTTSNYTAPAMPAYNQGPTMGAPDDELPPVMPPGANVVRPPVPNPVAPPMPSYQPSMGNGTSQPGMPSVAPVQPVGGQPKPPTGPGRGGGPGGGGN
jgi:hypothetical protein